MSKESTLKQHMKNIASSGGSAHTEAQRLARKENARKAREAKLRKRHGRVDEVPCCYSEDGRTLACMEASVCRRCEMCGEHCECGKETK